MKVIETHSQGFPSDRTPEVPMPVPIPPAQPAFSTPVLQVRPWADPVIDELGFDLRSAYVEHFWLSTLGPSTTFLLRRVAQELDRSPDGFELDLADTAGRLGLAARGGRNSPFMRAIDRTTKFGLARLHGDTFEVRRRVPPLTLAQVARLPEPLQSEHAAWQAANLSPNAQPDRQRRARRLALGLLDTGDDLEAVERQLHQWQFHPAVAHDAVRWATDQRHIAALDSSPKPAA
jgi:hypothetical protein